MSPFCKAGSWAGGRFAGVRGRVSPVFAKWTQSFIEQMARLYLRRVGRIPCVTASIAICCLNAAVYCVLFFDDLKGDVDKRSRYGSAVAMSIIGGAERVRGSFATAPQLALPREHNTSTQFVMVL